MNIDKLELGLEVKNYKAMCKLLDEPIIVTRGNSKKSQLNEWSRFFSWEKEGQKF